MRSVKPWLYLFSTDDSHSLVVRGTHSQVRTATAVVRHSPRSHAKKPSSVKVGASYNLDTVGQGPTALAVGAGGGSLDIFTLNYPFSPLSTSLWETAQYRLKYCLKGPLKGPKQPTNQSVKVAIILIPLLTCTIRQ